MQGSWGIARSVALSGGGDLALEGLRNTLGVVELSGGGVALVGSLHFGGGSPQLHGGGTIVVIGSRSEGVVLSGGGDITVEYVIWFPPHIEEAVVVAVPRDFKAKPVPYETTVRAK